MSVNMIIIERALELLIVTAGAPRMYATTRESFLQRIATIVEMVDKTFVPWKFYAKHLGLNGPEYKDPQGYFDDAWAREVINDASKIIEEVPHE